MSHTPLRPLRTNRRLSFPFLSVFAPSFQPLRTKRASSEAAILISTTECGCQTVVAMSCHQLPVESRQTRTSFIFQIQISTTKTRFPLIIVLFFIRALPRTHIHSISHVCFFHSNSGYLPLHNMFSHQFLTST